MKQAKAPNPEVVSDVLNSPMRCCDWTKCQFWSKCSSGTQPEIVSKIKPFSCISGLLQRVQNGKNIQNLKKNLKIDVNIGNKFVLTGLETS